MRAESYASKSSDGGVDVFMVVDFLKVKHRRWGETPLWSWSLWMEGESFLWSWIFWNQTQTVGGDAFMLVDSFWWRGTHFYGRGPRLVKQRRRGGHFYGRGLFSVEGDTFLWPWTIFA